MYNSNYFKTIYEDNDRVSFFICGEYLYQLDKSI